MGTDATPAPTPNETRVLLLPPTRRDADAICRLLTGEKIGCLVCPTLHVLCEEFVRGAGAVLVSEEAMAVDAEELVACVRGQPVWSDLAIIVLSRSGAETPRLTTLLPRLGNVSVVERPVRITTLFSIVRSALRARERQYEVRAHLAQLERADQELRGSEERLRLAVQTGKLGVWERDLATDTMTCSASFKANYGRGPDDPFTYADLWASVHPDDLPGWRSAVEQAITRHTDFEAEYRVIWPDGSTHWVLARGRPAFNAEYKPVRLVGVVVDITDRKNAEERRTELLESERTARTQAEHAGRMKDEFLATLSHELRTPLNAILGWSQILSTGTRDEEDLSEGLRTIERNARVQTQIIEDLLDMSRIISGKVRLDVQRIDLASVVSAAVDTVKPAADAKGVRLQAVLDPMAGLVSGDPNRLQQVFWNLLNNAVKFTPRDGRVHVVLQRVSSHCEVSVTDTGEGIRPDFLPMVFDRFRQADASSTRRHGGLGLGLAIVKQLVELHGGSAAASSPGLGKGSTFTVLLPVLAVHAHAEPSPDRRHPTGAPALVPASAWEMIEGATILAVDDEPDARGLIKRLLEDRKASVLLAASAAEAFELLQSHRPDVLVSDIGMPAEDGLSLIRRIRSLAPARGGQTPAIALTAYARSEDRVNAVRAGFQHHVAKPVEPSELIAIVASLLKHRTAGGPAT